jgi:hypothetical protein
VHARVLHVFEVRRRAIGREIADLHLQDLLPRPPDEAAAGLIDGDVVSIFVPDEDGDLAEALDGLTEEGELRDVEGFATVHAGSTSLNLAPAGSASS